MKNGFGLFWPVFQLATACMISGYIHWIFQNCFNFENLSRIEWVIRIWFCVKQRLPPLYIRERRLCIIIRVAPKKKKISQPVHQNRPQTRGRGAQVQMLFQIFILPTHIFLLLRFCVFDRENILTPRDFIIASESLWNSESNVYKI